VTSLIQDKKFSNLEIVLKNWATLKGPSLPTSTLRVGQELDEKYYIGEAVKCGTQLIHRFRLDNFRNMNMDKL